MTDDPTNAVLSDLPEPKRLALTQFLSVSSRASDEEGEVMEAIYRSLSLKAALSGRLA